MMRFVKLLPCAAVDEDIICEITHLSGASRKSSYYYEALSYVWGDAGPQKDKIIRIIAPSESTTQPGNYAQLVIRANCYAALSRLRYRERERVLWIDAICINQGDGDERAAQVRIMREICSDAGEVLIWLGDGGERTVEMIKLAFEEIVSMKSISKEAGGWRIRKK